MCPAEDAVLAEEAGVGCAEVLPVRTYVEVLAARSLTRTQRDRLYEHLRAEADEDAVSLRAGVARAQSFLGELDVLSPLAQAEARSAHLWEAGQRGGAFPAAAFPGVADVLAEAVAVWASSDAERLVLTEMDVEGWVRYVSLAREVQGATPLKLSVADRVTVYRSVQDRWSSLDRRGRIAMVALGPFWDSVRVRWQAVPYARQQAWAMAAPLPPPMVSTSLGYLEVVTESDIAAHVHALHEQLGPFRLGFR